MKKLVSMLLVLAMALSMVACGNEKEAVTAEVMEYDLTEEEYAFGVDKTQPELLTKVNDFVKKIKDDGTLEEIFDKYFGDGTPEGVVSAVKDETKDQLVVATNAAFEPFEYMEGDTYYGVDMEIAKLLADELDMELVIDNMEFDAVCLSVGQQKCDIAMAGLTVSEEREEYVTFSESYYQASQRLVVPSNDTVFAECKSADDVLDVLDGLKKDTTIGVQRGTTGQLFVEGDEEWGFDGFAVTCDPYSNGSLAIQAMLNGNIDYVIIDAAPAASITEAINAMQ